MLCCHASIHLSEHDSLHHYNRGYHFLVKRLPNRRLFRRDLRRPTRPQPQPSTYIRRIPTVRNRLISTTTDAIHFRLANRLNLHDGLHRPIQHSYPARHVRLLCRIRAVLSRGTLHLGPYLFREEIKDSSRSHPINKTLLPRTVKQTVR